MNKKIIKKLTAAFLGILFVMSMSITSMAAEPWDSIPNLLPYPNKAEFNKVVTIPLVFPKTIELKVQGANAQYKPAMFTQKAYADSISYSIIPGSTGALKLKEKEKDSPNVSGGYISRQKVEVKANAKYGPCIVKASNNHGGYVDLGVIINPKLKKPDVNNVKIRYFNTKVDSSHLLKSIDGQSINCDNVDTDIKFPTALDTSKLGTTEQKYANSSANTYLTSLTIKGHKYTNNPATYIGWMYGVYGSNGVKKQMCNYVGGEGYRLEAGDIVVWGYGSWCMLPETLPANLR